LHRVDFLLDQVIHRLTIRIGEQKLGLLFAQAGVTSSFLTEVSDPSFSLRLYAGKNWVMQLFVADSSIRVDDTELPTAYLAP
jgi:hypothetical protein